MEGTLQQGMFSFATRTILRDKVLEIMFLKGFLKVSCIITLPTVFTFCLENKINSKFYIGHL